MGFVKLVKYVFWFKVWLLIWVGIFGIFIGMVFVVYGVFEWVKLIVGVFLIVYMFW